MSRNVTDLTSWECLKKPKMILFDYGQTLVNAQLFDGVKGTEAVLGFATKINTINLPRKCRLMQTN